jgi:DIE2/ALG10 family
MTSALKRARPLGEERRAVLQPRVLLATGAVLVYIGLSIALSLLRFEPTRDEVHFWATTLQFTASPIPTIELLRSYNELNTPVPFMVWGWIEWAGGGGIVAGRLFNLLLSAAVLFLIGCAGPAGSWRPVLAAVGLAAFPYFLGTGVLLYTDMPAAAAVVAGVMLHGHGRHAWSAVCFALAIASRQYMIAFPLALAAHELWSRRAGEARPVIAWIAPLLAALTLAGWVALFGGLAPPVAAAEQNLHGDSLLHWHPGHGLYFLSALGAYFVLPEWLLRLRPRVMASKPAQFGFAVTALLIVIGFILTHPLRNPPSYPIETLGLLDKALRAGLPDAARTAVLCLLALLTARRFIRLDLGFWIVAFNVVILMKAHIGWDKYALAPLACLWLLAADPPTAQPRRAGRPDYQGHLVDVTRLDRPR